ncbi:nesprin-1-like isoform X3 [Ruditapes philippinarum]|uniref:nesprin-1-like isoform X3 n=1 Tax=Ruditapes philippinarum TaxID=129788 RepID=UPI00295B076A|nr:nesprin-1-like isoform X3 [Ruditapes philippinarum]
MGDMERHVSRFEKFSNLANRLSQVCEPSTRQEIKKTQSDIQKRWQEVFNELRARTEMFRACLQEWLSYEDEYNTAKTWLDAKDKLCDELVYGKEPRTRRDANLKNCQTLQRDLDHFQSQLANLYRMGEDVTKNMDPSSIVNITSKLSGLEQRLLTLRQKLAKHVQSLQGDMSQQRRFQEAFDNVKAFVSQAQRILGMEDPNRSADEKALGDRLEHLKELCVQFNDNSANLDALNDLGYRLALNETAAADLQDLNHKWHELFAETKERCKTLQGMLLIQQDFQSKCDTWMTFLAQTEADLSTEIAGNLIDLLAQQKKCEKFEAESYSRQQILHAIISDGQTMMNEGDIENKDEFQQKLILLANQWQSVNRRANQRKAIIDSTIKQWQSFNDMSEKLREWLKEKEEVLLVFNFDTASLQKVKNLVEKAKNTQNEFKLQEDLFKNMNTQGKQLLQRADNKAQEEIKVSMAQVQQHWHQIFVKLDGEREKLEGVLKQWRECEDDIEEILTWLKDTRKSLTGSLPHAYEELQADMHKCKDIEVAFANAEPKRQSLLALETSLSKTIEPEDLNVLHQRIRLLNKQWDELRNQASLRAQRIDDTMFRWSNFSQKFKDLCDWIDRMEVKVISSKDFHIEDLLNRMEKDFKNEMADKEKTKNDLVSQGHALMKVSSEVRASDIEQKVIRLEDKWEHLKAVIQFRERKLQETLLAVQQLDVSMSNLRKWLANMEDNISAPIIYQDCDRKEIQKKLQLQSELQHDIERHSPGVGSVLNLCEVLLHDSDACPTDVEFNGLQTAMKNLERRWRGICQLAPEQRTRIEETWQLWQKLIDDCRDFGDWLKGMESEVTDVAADQLNVSTSSEEYSRCESVQRKIHENLSKLENINRQYRRLAREGRTDSAGTLKTMMQDANDRWDRMQGKMSTNLREIRHSSSIRDDFKQTKDSLLKWLTEIDMQLTNIEHLSSMDVKTKLREMQRIQDEIDSRARKFDFLDEAALFLIQKGDSTDAITTQAEIDSFRQYHRQVLDRVAITNARLSAMQTEERMRLDGDDLDRLERELYTLAPGEQLTLDWDMKEIEAYLESSPPESPPEKRRALLKKLRERSRSRSTSPKKLPLVTAATHSTLHSSPTYKRRTIDTLDSAPLRSQRPESPRSRRPGSSSPTRSRSPTRSLRTKSPRRVAKDYVDSRGHSPSRQERFNRMKSELTHRGKEAQVEEILEKLADALEEATEKMDVADRQLRISMPIAPGVEHRSLNYLQSMTEAEKCVEDVRRIHRLLKEETGLHTIASADKQVDAVVSRWEMLQAGAIQKDYRLSQHRKDWHQFCTDLENMMSWLDEAEALQKSHSTLPGEITRLDSIIRQHKEIFAKDFLVQLESKKARVISINLTSRELVDPTTDEGRQLIDRLKQMNRRWDSVCAKATKLQGELQDALMQCQEFHHTIHDLLLWLEGIESKIQQCEPIKMGSDEAALWTRLQKLQDIKYDLEKNQPRVMSLRDTADQLLLNSDSPEMCQAKDKMHIIANRLKALLRLCSSYISSLETRLDTKSSVRSPDRSFELSVSPSSSGASSPRDSAIRTSTPTRPFRPTFRPLTNTSTSSRPRTRSPFALSRQLALDIHNVLSSSIAPHDLDTEDDNDIDTSCCPFLMRVLRTALPLQLLLLLLLAIACLVPVTEEDYSCILANNFRRSLDPMLQYTDGPPPV